MANDKVKCEGCGSMVWVGAKMHDGYCHDCYKRGRHLPPDEDDWLQSPKKKPKSNTTQPSTSLAPTYYPSLWTKIRSFIVRYRVLTYPLIAIFGIIITINAVSGLGNLFSSTPQNATSSDSPSGAVSNHTENNSNPFVGNDNSGAATTEQTHPLPTVPVRMIEESYCFVLQHNVWFRGGSENIQSVASFNMVRDGEIVRTVLAPLPERTAFSENIGSAYWEEIILKAAAEVGDIKYLIFRNCPIELSAVNKEILPDTVWGSTIAYIDADEPLRAVSIEVLRTLNTHFSGFRRYVDSIEQFYDVLTEHLGEIGVTDVVVIG